MQQRTTSTHTTPPELTVASVDSPGLDRGDALAAGQFQVITNPPPVLRADVCIVGAGVAGSALAWCLGRRGYSVIVVERDFRESDKFIGELLQPGGVKVLQRLGLESALSGIDAQVVTGYALFNNRKNFGIPYSTDSESDTAGRGFRYGKFVTGLRRAACSADNVRFVKGTAKSLLYTGTRAAIGGVEYSAGPDKNLKVEAPLTVLCDGAFSRLRTGLNTADQQIKSFMVGLLLENTTLPYPGYGHVFLTRESPFLVYPVTSSAVRVLVDFPGTDSPKASGRLKARLAEVEAALPTGMRPAFRRATLNLKVKAMPSKILAARPEHVSGAIMLGDSLNMRHPLTGGGMTVALSDAELLDNLLSDKNSNALSPARIESIALEFYGKRHASDASINILADALYDVMNYPALREACFDYLSRGRRYTEVPVSILSAMSRDSNLLLRRFSDVAIYAAKREMTPFRGMRSIRSAHRSLTEAANIIRPLVMNERPSWFIRTLVSSSFIAFPRHRGHSGPTTAVSQNAS